LAEDKERKAAIANEARHTVADSRKVLVLTERTDHLDSIRRSMEEHNLGPFVLHGRMSKKSSVRIWLPNWTHCRPTRRGSYSQRGDSSGKALTIPRSTR